MMQKLEVILLLLMIDVFAVKKEIVYEANYGKNIGEYLYVNYGNVGEESAVPKTFYVDGEMLIIDDCNNDRLAIIEYKKRNHQYVNRKQCLDIAYVNLSDSIIIDWAAVYRFNPDKSLKEIFKLLQKQGDILSFFVEHPKGYKIINTIDNRLYFDSSFKQIQKYELPNFIQEINGLIYFKDEKAMLSRNLKSLKTNLTKYYGDLTGLPKNRKVPTVFELPDSTEWGEYLNNDIDIEYLAYDTSYNTYWRWFTPIERKYKNAFEFNGGNYQENVVAIFSFDRLGKLRFWFPEPELENCWKRYSGGIVINRDGRIFQMNYYSLANKPSNEISKTKGIQVVEYILDAKDFSHKERVKMYGSKTK